MRGPILVPVDFSEPSDRALELAMSWAPKLGTGLYLAHLLEPPFEAWDRARDELDARAGRAIDRGLACEAKLIGRGHDTNIAEVASGADAGLIVIGTHGRGGWRRAVLGSRAEHTMRHATCPVVTLGPGVSCPAALRTIVAATDFSQPARSAASTALELDAALGPSRFVLVHADTGPPDLVALMEEQGKELPAPGDLEGIEQRLKSLVDELGCGDREIEFVIRGRRATTLILETAEEREADLIALGTHGRSGLARAALGSVAEVIVRTAPCPVLTVRQ